VVDRLNRARAAGSLDAKRGTARNSGSSHCFPLI
jgi:hypothetical protein